jgi:hypothetical protein
MKTFAGRVLPAAKKYVKLSDTFFYLFPGRFSPVSGMLIEKTLVRQGVFAVFPGFQPWGLS